MTMLSHAKGEVRRQRNLETCGSLSWIKMSKTNKQQKKEKEINGPKGGLKRGKQVRWGRGAVKERLISSDGALFGSSRVFISFHPSDQGPTAVVLSWICGDCEWLHMLEEYMTCVDIDALHSFVFQSVT